MTDPEFYPVVIDYDTARAIYMGTARPTFDSALWEAVRVARTQFFHMDVVYPIAVPSDCATLQAYINDLLENPLEKE